MSAEGEPPHSTSESRGLRPDAQMNAIGYLIIVLLLPVLVPLAPFLAVAWLLSRARG